MVDCDGCPSWHLCTNCSVLGDVRRPACAATLDHTTSLERTGTLETLDLDSGYWRATDTSSNILSCFSEDACEGGAAVGSYCATGYEGPCECFSRGVMRFFRTYGKLSPSPKQSLHSVPAKFSVRSLPSAASDCGA